jgi:hypothetical protein
MPVPVPAGNPTICIRRAAFERAKLTRAQFDTRFNLTDEEFRVEGQMVVVGPLVGDDALDDIIAELEETGLEYFEDFFELSGNWPEWVAMFVAGG